MLSAGKGRFFLLIDKLSLILAIIGGLNWGLIGVLRFDLVAFLFGGADSVMSRIIYTAVGLAAVWCITLLCRGSCIEQRRGSRE